MKNKDLIQRLTDLDPEADIEFEVPAYEGSGRINPGDRYDLLGVRETFYNDTRNKWIVLTG